MTNLLTQETPSQIARSLAQRARARRKERGLTQVECAKKSGVSLGSLRRFESTGEVSLKSLIKLAIVLDSEAEFAQLFTHKQYRSLQEIIDEQGRS